MVSNHAVRRAGTAKGEPCLVTSKGCSFPSEFLVSYTVQWRTPQGSPVRMLRQIPACLLHARRFARKWGIPFSEAVGPAVDAILHDINACLLEIAERTAERKRSRLTPEDYLAFMRKCNEELRKLLDCYATEIGA
jgi:hypothetical protein